MKLNSKITNFSLSDSARLCFAVFVFCLTGFSSSKNTGNGAAACRTKEVCVEMLLFFYVLLVRGVVLLCNTSAANKIKTSFSSQSVHSGFTVHRISFLYLASLSQSRCQHVHMKEALLAACH